jgi:hypothetical protein
VSYWDVGVRGDTGPSNHGSGFRLSPTYSVLDDVADYPGANNLGTNPAVVSQYCNGSRVPPECTAADGCGGASGYGVPPGIVDASTPNPVFSLTPAATVDEGNNWINVSWGPLALTNPAIAMGTGPALGNYALQASSPDIDYVPVAQPHPSTDFFGNPRPDPAVPGAFDVGAVEFQGTGTGGGGGGGSAAVSITPNPLTITLAHLVITGTGTVTLTNSAASTTPVTVTNVSVSGGSLLTYFFNVVTDNCTGVPLNPGQSCTVVVRFTNVLAARGTNRAGTITFTDNATGSPQTSGLIGHANP